MKTEAVLGMTISEQFRVLFSYDTAPRSALNFTEIAEATGISDQALANLLQGKSTNPRLRTLLTLCQYYGISLDYFECETVAACREYLYAHRLRHTSPLIGEIADAAGRLSAKGQRNVLTLMEWMRLGNPDTH